MPLEDQGWAQEEGFYEITNNIGDADDPDMIPRDTKQLIKSLLFLKVHFW